MLNPSYSERVVYDILSQAKKMPHKFNIPYEYDNIKTSELKNVIALLLKCNISVALVNVGSEISTIRISHNTTKSKAKVEYLTTDANAYSVSMEKADNELVEKTSYGWANIINMLKFDLSYS